MKTRKTIETKIEVEMFPQDVFDWAIAKGIVPADWKFYSAEIEGHGISKGAKITLRHTDFKEEETKP